MKVLKNALLGTTSKRGSGKILTRYPEIISEIRSNTGLQNLWQKYQKQFEYAKGICFDDACDAVKEIMESIQ